MHTVEAIRRINEAIETNSAILNLANLGLENIPDEVFTISNLSWLRLNNNKIKNIPKNITKLHNLTNLYINNNKITNINALLFRLKKLEVIDFSNNNICAIPDEIGQATTLKRIHLANNKLITLPNTIENLLELNYIDLTCNHITQLPQSIATLNINAILLRGNNIIAKGIKEAEQLPTKEYLQYILSHQTDEAKKPLNEAKVVFIGDSSVGKTSLIKMLTTNRYDPNEPTTHVVTIYPWEVQSGENSLTINLWDFGGQDVQHGIHQFFFTERTLYVLVLLSRTEDRHEDVNYWLTLLNQQVGACPILVVINKVDSNPNDIDRASLTRDYTNIVNFCRCSCEMPELINNLKTNIIKSVKKLPHMNDNLLSSWIAIKNEINAMSDNYIDISRFSNIFKKHDSSSADNAQSALLLLLRDIGNVVYFPDDPELSELGVLKPQWVTTGVYSIISDPIIQKFHGIFTFADLKRILDPQDYPTNCQRYVLDIMIKFELCYPLDTPGTYLIPRLLEDQTPRTVSKNFQWSSESLRLILKLDIIPSSLIPKFIVRNHKHVCMGQQWRGGAVLQIGNNLVCIRRAIKNPELSVEITGEIQTRSECLSIIIHQVISLLTRTAKQSLELFIPLKNPRFPAQEKEDEEFLIPMSALKRLERHKVLEYYDARYDIYYNPMDLLSGYKTEMENQSMASEKYFTNRSQVITITASPTIQTNTKIDSKSVSNSNSSSKALQMFNNNYHIIAGELRYISDEILNDNDPIAKQISSKAESLASDIELLKGAETDEAIIKTGLIKKIGSFLKRCTDTTNDFGRLCVQSKEAYESANNLLDIVTNLSSQFGS
jgi:small GTP-binding protein